MPPSPPTSAAQPWTVTLDKATLSDYTLLLTDETTLTPVTAKLDQIAMTVQGLTTRSGEKGKVMFAFRLNEHTSFQTGGDVQLTPLLAELDLALQKLSLADFAGYVPAAFNVKVAGDISTSGHVAFTAPPNDKPATTFTGQFALADLAVTDRPGAATFLKLGALDVSGIDARTAPLAVRLDLVKLVDLVTEARLNQDGTLNFNAIMTNPPQAAGEGAPAAAAPATITPGGQERPKRSLQLKLPIDLTLAQLRVEKGRIDIVDQTVKPIYSTSLSDIQLALNSVSSDPRQESDVTLGARMGDYGMLAVSGKLRPFREQPGADVTVQVTNLGLPAFSPYSEKFISYPVSSGKLALDLKCNIDGTQLTSENHLVVDQLTLGDRVEGGKGTNLPIKLAIALLKNRKGQIDLSMPVNGTLNDPNFSYGHAVEEFLTNLVEKAATAPFALLGSIFGSAGEDLSYVEFESGSAVLTPAAEEKLDHLVSALYDRPALTLSLAAYVDVEQDAASLRETAMQREIKEQEVATLPPDQRPAAGASAIAIAPDEYGECLARAFRAGGYARRLPRTRREPSLSLAEMEQVMRANVVPSAAEFAALAEQRAAAVRDHLLKSGKVETERIKMTKFEGLAPPTAKDGKLSRVIFTLE